MCITHIGHIGPGFRQDGIWPKSRPHYTTFSSAFYGNIYFLIGKFANMT